MSVVVVLLIATLLLSIGSHAQHGSDGGTIGSSLISYSTDSLDVADAEVSAGLAAGPTLLEWLTDQVYIFKTMALALADKLETPDFELVRTEQSYQVREYPEARWVCTYQHTAGFFSSVDDRDVFRRLFRYFSGKNSAGKRMTVTSPMLLRKSPSFHGAGRRFDACLPLPRAHQADPPAPLSSRVSLETFPKSRVLALRFSHYADEQEWREESQELLRSARQRAEDGVDYNNFYFLTYDLPQKFWHRRNEVWLRGLVPSHPDREPTVRYITDNRHV